RGTYARAHCSPCPDGHPHQKDQCSFSSPPTGFYLPYYGALDHSSHALDFASRDCTGACRPIAASPPLFRGLERWRETIKGFCDVPVSVVCQARLTYRSVDGFWHFCWCVGCP